jgi:hypothetical protein
LIQVPSHPNDQYEMQGKRYVIMAQARALLKPLRQRLDLTVTEALSVGAANRNVSSHAARVWIKLKAICHNALSEDGCGSSTTNITSRSITVTIPQPILCASLHGEQSGDPNPCYWSILSALLVNCNEQIYICNK